MFIPKQLEGPGVRQSEASEFLFGASDHCREARREREQEFWGKLDAAKNRFFNLFRYGAILIFLFATACASAPQTPKKTLVLVSIPPYQEIVERIGGEAIEVVAVAPPASDPHTYEPTARQMSKLAEAALWFQIGEPFEGKIGMSLQAKRIDLREGIALLHDEGAHCPSCHHHEGEGDRHIWLSAKDMQLQAAKIAQALSSLMPEQKAFFTERLERLQLELQAVDQEIASRLTPLTHRAFVVSHPAFAYFCRDYNLTQLSVEHEGKEPRPKELEALLKEAATAHPSVAVTIPQHNNRGTELVAKQLKLSVHSIDPYSPDYFGTLQELSRVLHESD